MNMGTAKILLICKVLLVLMGVLLGFDYFWEAFGAYFTASGGEPAYYDLLFFPFIFILPFAVLGAVWPRLGGVLLILGGLISLISNFTRQCYWPRFRFFGDGPEYFNSPSLFHCMPMILIGVLFLVLGIYNQKLKSRLTSK